MKKFVGISQLSILPYWTTILVCFIFAICSIQAQILEKPIPNTVPNIRLLAQSEGNKSLEQQVNQQVNQIEELNPVSRPQTQPKFSLQNIILFILNIFGIVLTFFFGLFLLAKGIGWLVETGQAIQLSQFSWGALTILLLVAPVSLFILGRSQAAIVDSWQLPSPMIESSYFNGTSPNLYQFDFGGRITKLRFRQSEVPDLRQLAEIEKLNSLTEVEISISLSKEITSAVANTNSIDLNVFKNAQNLEVLRLDGLDLSRVQNLEKLPTIKKLWLTRCNSVSLDRINALNGLKELYLNGSDVISLNALAASPNLETLSIADTKVISLAGLENLDALRVIDIRGTDFDADGVQYFFKRPITIISGTSAAQPEINSAAWRWLKIAGIILIFFTMLSFLPLNTFFRRNGVALAQRVFKSTIIGLALLWFLFFLAYLEQPNEAMNAENLQSRFWFIIYSSAWLLPWIVLRPAILLLLETRIVGSSPWAISLKVFACVIPILTIIFPFALLATWGGISIIRNSRSVFALIFLIPVFAVIGAAIFWATITLTPAFAGRRQIALFKQLCKGEDDGINKVIEIPLNYAPATISLKPLAAALGRYLLKIFKPETTQNFELFSVPSIGMLKHAPVLPTVKNNFRGVIVLISSGQLANARRWEMSGLRKWIQSAYQYTAAPIWIVGDWFGELVPSSIEMQQHLNTLNSIQPYISNLVRLPSIPNALGPTTLPTIIADCLDANELTDENKLNELGLGVLLDFAFTPVAVLLRSVFGEATLTDRLDTMFRTVEAAAAFWSLVFIIEFEADVKSSHTVKEEKIKRGINKVLKNEKGENKPLVFSGWASLLNTFCNNSDSDLVRNFANEFDSPCHFSYTELRNMLSIINEQSAIEVPEEIKTRRQLLSLLIALRNVTTAHGSATQAASPELYLEILSAALDLLIDLPWNKAVLLKIEANGTPVFFSGCVQQTEDEIEKFEEVNQTLVFINHEDEEKVRILNAEKYFQVDAETRSVAIYIGEINFFDLLFGTRRSE